MPTRKLLTSVLCHPATLRCAAAALALCTQALAATPASPAALPGPAATAAPTGLWIPPHGGNQGQWLLLSADHRVLREGLKGLFEFRAHNGQLLPVPAQDPNGRWGFLSPQGQWALAPTLEELRNFAEEDGLARFKQAGLWGYIGTDMKVRIKPSWPQAAPFYNGRAAVQSKDEKWGVIDTSGAVVVPPQYRVIGPKARNGLARVAIGEDRWAYIDAQGKTRFQTGKSLALDFGEFDVAPVEVNDQWGLKDPNGRWVVEPRFESLDGFQPPGLAAFRRKYQFGYVDLQGREVIAPGEHSRSIAQGLIRSGSAGSSHFSFIDTRGKTAIPGPFDWVGDFPEEGTTPARRQGQWGLLNARGQWLNAGEQREPLLDTDSNPVTARNGLSPWLQAGQAIEWKNEQAQTVYRLTQKAVPGSKQWVLQLQAGDKTVWTSAPQKAGLNLEPFFEPRAQDSLAFADAALVNEAKRLLAAAPRPFLPYSLVYGSRKDPYDLKDLDEDDKEEIVKGGMTTLAETYVSEEQWGGYYFLSDQRGELFKRLATQVCQTLQLALGKPLPLGPKDDRHWQGREKRCAWQRGDRQLMVVDYFETGDGDFEHQLSLVVLPNR